VISCSRPWLTRVTAAPSASSGSSASSASSRLRNSRCPWLRSRVSSCKHAVPSLVSNLHSCCRKTRACAGGHKCQCLGADCTCASPLAAAASAPLELAAAASRTRLPSFLHDDTCAVRNLTKPDIAAGSCQWDCIRCRNMLTAACALPPGVCSQAFRFGPHACGGA
jgi:hypothetical protein